ncbi:hypothetical protein K7B09_12825 [Thermomonas sp. RSS23]|uniref:Uncharacterized protein n=1 Tax=Thermomonas beijingensis TaxID=2872701 RepID=A0ABS7TH67_9GAMM|nr:hypothetical protein [Thermomonas beijingensis]MBZ4187205.1 hypothetical protein [Thermomonas beijingensis]
MKKEASALKVGDWWAPCCLHDLTQIKNEGDLSDAVEMAQDEEFGLFAGGWDTCSEAVDELIADCDRDERMQLLHWHQSRGGDEQIAREISRHLG